MGNILEEFQKQVLIDKEEENYNIELEHSMTEEEYKAYTKEVDRLREEMAKEQTSQFQSKIQNKSYPNSLVGQNQHQDEFQNLTHDDLKNEKVDIGLTNIYVEHAYCPHCNQEIKATKPKAYNPFNFEGFCPYECPSCGNKYHIDDRYPRLVLEDSQDNKWFLYQS